MKFKQKSWNLDHGIVEGKRGKFKLNFRPWHGGRPGEILKSSILDHAIVEGKSGTINKQ